MKPFLLIVILLATFSPEKANKIQVAGAQAGPPVLVYKTRKNYSRHVPVMLSEDKKRIISYPAPTDVKQGNSYPVPTRLKKGYLLDNRGIGLNVAYLKLTYSEYARLSRPPSLDSMYAMIIDKDPITEMCNCGSRYAMTDPAKQVNGYIKNGTLKTECKVLK